MFGQCLSLRTSNDKKACSLNLRISTSNMTMPKTNNAISFPIGGAGSVLAKNPIAGERSCPINVISQLC